jgi:hypothetical protein
MNLFLKYPKCTLFLVTGVLILLTEKPGRWALIEVTPLLEKGVTYEEFRTLHREFNKAAIEVAREEKIPCIDLAAGIPQEAELFYHAIHLNGKGSELAAQIISDKLLKIVSERNIIKRLEYSINKWGYRRAFCKNNQCTQKE